MFHWIILPADFVWIKDACGYIAGSLVLATFSVKSMPRLRCIGIASNVAFISYAILASMPPILILHGMLLPVNVFHLIRIWRGRDREAVAPTAHPSPWTPAGAAADAGHRTIIPVCDSTLKPPTIPASSWQM